MPQITEINCLEIAGELPPDPKHWFMLRHLTTQFKLRESMNMHLTLDEELQLLGMIKHRTPRDMQYRVTYKYVFPRYHSLRTQFLLEGSA